NDGANELKGEGDDDTLEGGAGNDTLVGGLGLDSFVGGAGDDLYVVDDTGEEIIEIAAGGDDTVESSVTYTLGSELEGLVLTGTAAINATGNELANVLYGNAGNNVLDGGLGNDTMFGEMGNDTYIVNSDGDMVFEFVGDNGESDTIKSSVSINVNKFNTRGIEVVILTGTGSINATGNGLDNCLNGNDGDNLIDGGAGNDMMAGGGGID